jgi:hypothetical protein
MKNDTCKNLKFEDCELAILRQAVDTAEEKQGKIVANSPEIKRIIGIVENFIRKKQLIQKSQKLKIKKILKRV